MLCLYVCVWATCMLGALKRLEVDVRYPETGDLSGL